MGPGLCAKDLKCLPPARVHEGPSTRLSDPRESHRGPPTSPGDSPRQAGRFGPGSYGVAAFVPEPGVCETVCETPPREESPFLPVLCSSCKSCWPSMPKVLGALSPDARLLGWGAWCGTQSSHLFF